MIFRVVGCELSAHSSAVGEERSGAAKLAAEERCWRRARL